MNMLQLFSPGDVLYGYCNGYFGRDSYNDKTVVSVRPQYIVVEDESGYAQVLNLRDGITMEHVKAWKRVPEEDAI